MSTKDRIIDTATKYFNKNSFGSTSLFELAKAIGISRGNLTYHFKTKDELLAAISNDMWLKIGAERSKSRQFPSFENLHNEVQLYYKFQKKYAFIFLDTHVLNHPKVKKQFREMTSQSIQDFKAAIAFSIQSGNMKEESVPGTYSNIAFITWMLTFFWLPQQIIRGTKKEEDGEKLIWSILIPHLTEKGLKAFTSYFGKDYLSSIGPAFQFDINEMITF